MTVECVGGIQFLENREWAGAQLGIYYTDVEAFCHF